MAAGLGFKTFTTGEVLSASDVNGYLMQGVLVFASAAARDAAITSPQEGQFAYLKDTNVTTYYTGSAWANLDTTGMTNPMTTTGDTIYSSSGSTPARLGIGTTGQVLTVSGGVPTWATAASTGSSFALLNSGGTSLTGGTVTISGISANKLFIVVAGGSLAAGGNVNLRFNSDTSSIYSAQGFQYRPGSSYDYSDASGITTTDTSWSLAWPNGAASTFSGGVNFDGTGTSGVKVGQSIFGVSSNGVVSPGNRMLNLRYTGSSAITSISLIADGTTFDAGTIFVYGA